ncbi:energy transducer TonB [Entomohabitans teleogrylli]|uniref:energy transducer TonB n=1 Tax=Entomohabitans teleogrylli TaxID=1384589 RepID=UPI00073D9C11|nr:energy transducer TonB [Entomohabitans teleogrylli]
MTSMTLDLPRRFPWSPILSIGLHGAVIAGLLYTSVHQGIELPAPVQPISITMVAPADLEPPQAVQPPAQPVVEPEPEPEPEVLPEPPKEAPVVIHKPKPKPRPKPKPKPVEKKPEREVKPVEPRPVTTPSASNNTTAAARTAPTNQTSGAQSTVSAPQGPKVLSRGEPVYPQRAQALRIEGNVRIRFDVNSDGRVENLQILSAQPANMFERDVKNAAKRWRYLPGRPGKGLVLNIQFKINGGTTIQ